MIGIRVGHHPGFDCVVVDLDGVAPGFAVRYVKRLRADPSGEVVVRRPRDRFVTDCTRG